MPRALNLFAIVSLAVAGCNGKSSDGNGTGGTGQTGGTGGGPPAPLGTLWVGGSGSLSPAALVDGGETPAFDQNCFPPTYSPVNPLDGVAVIDGQGNLWSQFADGTVGQADSAPIYKWSASQLASCASSTPDIFPLTDEVYCGGEGGGCDPFFSVLAFDSEGNLWGSEITGQPAAIFVYRASDLAGTGQSLTAAVQIGAQECGPIDALCSPVGLAFDSSGYLWIGNGYSVIAYSPATQLAVLAGDAGSPAADLLITTPQALAFDGGGRGYYLHYSYNYLAFDRSGNLWATVDNGQGDLEHQIVEFSKAQLQSLATDKTPTPVLTVTETSFQRGHTFLGWEALAFDTDGNLWSGASMFEPNLYRFSPASLADGGLPDITLEVSGDPSISLIFDPIPPGLPLLP
jgi:hypothetical protein